MAKASSVDITKRRKQFENFVVAKNEERREARQARLYFHGSHWTEDQLRELKKRGQPPTTTALYARKINGFVGLLEKLKQDPKAYPRSQNEDQAAELCTAALRYALDQQDWNSITPIVALNSAVEGIGAVEVSLEEGDTGQEGDYDIRLGIIDPQDFFYDPRSFKHDFSDARFMGVAKWLDREDAKALYPGAEEAIDGIGRGQGAEFTWLTDKQVKWVNNDLDQIFVVEHWYREGQKWMFCVYCGSTLIEEGRTYLFDEKGRDECRYVAYRSFVDQDGDTYSFFRNMKSLVDEINQRGSKALHLLSMRRIKMEKGAVIDIEKLRSQAVRPDGVIEYEKGFELEFEDAKSLADMKGQLEMKAAAQTDLENFGPNPALLGQGVENKSGRAIKMLQEAGIAELGPFMLANKNWKIRIYRCVWNAIRRYWTAERSIRVTDEDDSAQFIPLNQQQIDPMTGQAVIVNKIGALDVDIILDEGPDTINMQGDAFDTMSAVSQSIGQMVPELVIELSPLQGSVKRKYIELAQQRMQAQLQAEQQKQQQNPADGEREKLMLQMQARQAESQHAMAMKQAEGEQQLQMRQAETAQNLEARRAESELNLEVRQREADLELTIKRELAQIELARKDQETEMSIGAKYADNDMTLRHKDALREQERAGKAEDDDKESAREEKREAAIEKMLAKNSETVAQAIEAMTDALASIAGPKQISIERDKSGAIIGGKTKPVNEARV